MSRIGRMPVTIPAGVEVSVAEPNVVTVKGPKGTLTQTMRPEMIIKVEDGVIQSAVAERISYAQESENEKKS